MCNHHLRNVKLSLKAKGLLSLMLSLPEDWDYTTKGLACICKDGVDAIASALKELEQHGYVSTEKEGLPDDSEREDFLNQFVEGRRRDGITVCAGVMPGVTREQIQAAREAGLFCYLQTHEPGVLKRDGSDYRHKEHDSLVYVTGKRYWYWNSRGRSINALDYLMEIQGYGLVEAVRDLTGGAKKLPPVTAANTDLWFMDYREFAIAPENLEYLMRQETDRIAGRVLRSHGSGEDSWEPDSGKEKMTNILSILNRPTGMFAEDQAVFISALDDYILLILDDLEVERNTEYALEQMFLVIRHNGSI